MAESDLLDGAPDTDLFAARVTRYEEVSRRLMGLRRDYAQALITERQQKAAIYEANMNVSHGERQGLATAQTSPIATDILTLKAEIEVMEDERRMLETLIQWVA